MNRNSIIALFVVAVLVVVGIFYTSQNKEVPTTETTTQQEINTTSETSIETPSGMEVSVTNVQTGDVTVTYSDSGFSPSIITVKQGTKVTFVKSGSKNMWVAVDEHPSHTEYAGTSRQEHCPDTTGSAFDQCATGSTYTFTFNKTGAWDYHNHVMAGDTGKVIVVQ